MNDLPQKKSRPRTWLYALLGMTAVSALVYLATFFADAAGSDVTLLGLLHKVKAQGALNNLLEVIAGALGIIVTVVAIIVELAANRYTPRIADLFVESPINLGVLGFYIVTSILCLWVSITGSTGFNAWVGTITTLVAITLCLVILLPYFAFVFGFLDPHNVVERMGGATLESIHRAVGQDPHTMHARQQKSVRGIEQLTDVALNAIEHKDKGICMHAIDTLGELTCSYLASKPRLPASWFVIDHRLKDNPDFVSMQEEVLTDIAAGRYWLEMKVLRQYQMLYGETLNRMRDVNYLIAINTRRIAEAAFAAGDEGTGRLTLKFFNTFLRATINGKDVRTAYNVLNQYRRLAEWAVVAGRTEVAVEITQRFKYYGQLGFASGLPFVLETAAYDLCALCELAFDRQASCLDALLAVFLEVDKEGEVGADLEASLRGVRKAQVKLATHYLEQGAVELARIIFNDMRTERRDRLDSIREELAGITSRDFWEISDRGVNFDYLEPGRRAMLDTFFGWFRDEAASASNAQQQQGRS